MSDTYTVHEIIHIKSNVFAVIYTSNVSQNTHYPQRKVGDLSSRANPTEFEVSG